MGNMWSKIREEHSADGNVLFASKIEGKVRLRIIAKSFEDTGWFHLYHTEYEGKTMKNYAINCARITKDEETGEAVLTPIIFIAKPTIFSSILKLLEDDTDVLSPEDGFAITVLKEGTGLTTKYDVQLLPKPIFNVSDIEALDLHKTVEKLSQPKDKELSGFGNKKKEPKQTGTENVITLSFDENEDEQLPF
jgi:hypothetical protein